jgi:hypothetical protein
VKSKELVATSSTLKLLKRSQAAELLNVSISSLDRWRLLGCGPVYRKLSGGVFYTLADIEAFVETGKRISTGRTA